MRRNGLKKYKETIKMVFVSAKEGPPNYGPKEPYTVQYFDEHGNMTIKSGGIKTWRNNTDKLHGRLIYESNPGGSKQILSSL